MINSPVIAPCRVTQHFGAPPDYYAKYGLKGHNGTDITGPTAGVSVPIYAPIEGHITIAGLKGDYGECVRIVAAPDWEGKRKEVTLGHFATINKGITVGQWVKLGEVVGMMGKTGDADGIHCHFGLRYLDNNGLVINPNNGFDGFVPVGPTQSSEEYVLFSVFQPQLASLVEYPYG